MRVRATVIAAMFSWLLLSQPLAAQRVNVRWETTANDQIGMTLSTRVRERLASSPLFSLVYGESNSAIVAHFVTINPDEEGRQQLQTTYALVINARLRNEAFERYLDTIAGVCGNNRIALCAESIVATIDQYANQIRNLSARPN